MTTRITENNCTNAILRPEKEMEPIKLDKLSEMAAPMTISSGMLFPGSIDQTRWEQSIEKLLHYCPWIAGWVRIKENEELFVVPRADTSVALNAPNGYVLVEHENRSTEEYSDTIALSELLPKHCPKKMIEMHRAIMCVDRLPIAVFKTVQFSEHFVLTYRLNHLFFDQSSIVHLFTFLGSIYNGLPSDTPPTVKPPIFIPKAHIAEDVKLQRYYFDKSRPKGYGTESSGDIQLMLAHGVVLEMNHEAVVEFGAKSKNYKLSTNDVVHGVLAKAMVIRDKYHRPLRMCFARNMRSVLDLGSEVMGDYVRLEVLELSPAVSQVMSILTLSELSRILLQKDCVEQYKKECRWFMDLAEHTGNPKARGYVDIHTDIGAAMITNWSSFPYQDINIGGAVPTEIFLEKTIAMARSGCSVRILHKGLGDDRKLYAHVDTPHPYIIKNLKEIGEKTGLFTCTDKPPVELPPPPPKDDK